MTTTTVFRYSSWSRIANGTIAAVANFHGVDYDAVEAALIRIVEAVATRHGRPDVHLLQGTGEVLADFNLEDPAVESWIEEIEADLDFHFNRRKRAGDLFDPRD